MDEQQQKIMRWILFMTILLLFVIISGLTLNEVFFAQESNLVGDERNLLFNTFLVAVGTSIIALFYSMFGLKRGNANSTELDKNKEHLVRLNFDDFVDIKSFFGKEVECTPIAKHSERFEDIKCYIIDSGGPTISIKPPIGAKSLLISFEINNISYSGSFALDCYLVDMVGEEQ